MILFIGSVGNGRRVVQASAERVTPVVMELGGKDAFIVCDDADLEQAVHAAMSGCFINCGQNCVASERILVARRDLRSLRRSRAGADERAPPGLQPRRRGRRRRHRDAAPARRDREARRQRRQAGRAPLVRRQARPCGAGELLRADHPGRRDAGDGHRARGAVRPGHAPHARQRRRRGGARRQRRGLRPVVVGVLAGSPAGPRHRRQAGSRHDRDQRVRRHHVHGAGPHLRRRQSLRLRPHERARRLALDVQHQGGGGRSLSARAAPTASSPSLRPTTVASAA